MTYTKDNIEILPYPTNSRERAANLTGLTFNYLTVLGFAGRDKWYVAHWWSECKCGNIIKPPASELKSGHTQSCGCWMRELNRTLHLKHGKRHSIIYGIWSGMISRCNNPNVERYPNYGGRGIEVCERWKDFKNFYADMGNRPSKAHSINRIDNNDHYCPENCEWALDEPQRNNKQNSHYVTLGAKTQTVAQWLRELGMQNSTFYRRIKRGLSDTDALSMPIRVYKSRSHSKSVEPQVLV